MDDRYDTDNSVAAGVGERLRLGFIYSHPAGGGNHHDTGQSHSRTGAAVTLAGPARIVVAGKDGRGAGGTVFSLVDLGDSARLLLMFSPQRRGPFAEQAQDAMRAVETALGKTSQATAIVAQTVFLRHA